MTTEAENAGQAALRGAQREYGHFLTTAEVAAIAEVAATALDVQRNADGGACAAITCLIGDDVPALAAQDARWRALVGEYRAVVREWFEADAHLEGDDLLAWDLRLLAVDQRVQAALDGTR